MRPDALDRLLLDACQRDFPLVERPYAALAERLGTDEKELLRRMAALREAGLIRRLSAIFDSSALGYRSVLLAFRLTPDELEPGARRVQEHPGITHHYERDHPFNLWSTLTVPPGCDLNAHAAALAVLTGAARWLFLPALRVFKIGVNFAMSDTVTEKPSDSAAVSPRMGAASDRFFSGRDKDAVRLLQTDLPVAAEPFRALIEMRDAPESAREFTPAALLESAREFLDAGVMRRYAAVLGHHAAGYTHNIMSAWSVPPEQAGEAGARMAGIAGISHCYQRPAHPPDWPYTHFCMLHARDAGEAQGILDRIADETGLREYAALRSVREFKKTRMLYFTGAVEEWEKQHLQNKK